MSKSKYDAIRIAKQLCYDNAVIAAIVNAKSENEISRIMREARLRED